MQFKLMTFKNIIHQPPQRDDGKLTEKEVMRVISVMSLRLEGN